MSWEELTITRAERAAHAMRQMESAAREAAAKSIGWDSGQAASTYREAAEALTEAAETIRRLEGEKSDLIAESAALTKALTGLTASGSEFFIRKGDRYVADTKACVEYVEKARQGRHATIKGAIRAKQAAEAELSRLRTRVGELEGALNGIDADFMTSERHHPDYVLIPAIKFERLCEASATERDTDLVCTTCRWRAAHSPDCPRKHEPWPTVARQALSDTGGDG